MPRPFRAVILASFLIWVSLSLAIATAGFAEWETRTPGGHLISHVDGFKEEHGDCLRSESSTHESRIWVSHLLRWRYYEGLVVGESEQGLFAFDERDEELIPLQDVQALKRLLAERNAGPPLSGWLTGADGWREAWFPFAVWAPCREAMARGVTAPADMTGVPCRQGLAEENLRFLRRTTWGHQCRRFLEADAEQRAGAPPHIAGFCDALLASGK